MILEGGRWGGDTLTKIGKLLHIQGRFMSATLCVILFVSLMGLVIAGLYMKQYKACTASTDKNAKKWYTFVVVLFVIFCLFGVGSVVGLGYNSKFDTKNSELSKRISQIRNMLPRPFKSRSNRPPTRSLTRTPTRSLRTDDSNYPESLDYSDEYK